MLDEFSYARLAARRIGETAAATVIPVGTGMVKAVAGALAIATPGSDYVVPVSGAGMVKTAAGALSLAIAGTDYVYPLGVAGGQTVIGGTADGDDLLFQSTGHANKGLVALGSLTTGFIYDEVNNRVGLGCVPGCDGDLTKNVNAPVLLRVVNSNNGASARAMCGLVSGSSGEVNLEARGSGYTSTAIFGETFVSGACLYSTQAGNFGVGTVGAGALKFATGNTVRTVYSGSSARVRNFISTDTWELDYASPAAAPTGSAVRHFCNANGAGFGYNTYYDTTSRYSRAGAACGLTTAVATAGGMTAGDMRFTIYPVGVADAEIMSSVIPLTLRATGTTTFGGCTGVTTYGGVASGGDWLCSSTEHGTKGKWGVGSLTTGLVYDEATACLGVGGAPPSSTVRVYSAYNGAGGYSNFYARNNNAAGQCSYVNYSENAQDVWNTFGSTTVASQLGISVQNGSCFVRTNGAGNMVIGTGVAADVYIGAGNVVAIKIDKTTQALTFKGVTYGGLTAGGTWLCSTTEHATKGTWAVGSLTTGLVYDETNKRLGIGAAPGNFTLNTQGPASAASTQYLLSQNDVTTGRVSYQLSAGGSNLVLQSHGSAWTTTSVMGNNRQSGGGLSSSGGGDLFLAVTSATGSVILGTNDTARLTIDASGYTSVSSRLCEAKGANVVGASTITLGAGNYFIITVNGGGMVGVDFITTTGWTAGSVVTLEVSDMQQITDNASTPPANTAVILLNGGTQFLPYGETGYLTLRYNGTAWVEIGRSLR